MSSTKERKTYYLTKELNDALSYYAVCNGTDKSEVVEGALRQYIPHKYLSDTPLFLTYDTDDDKKEESDNNYIRRTYKLPPEVIRAVKLMAVFEHRYGNDIVRASLKAFIPANYFKH